jgi:hypothetical protein
MPKYYNSNSTPVDIEELHLDPLETKTTYKWLTVLPSGVTKLADAPFTNTPIYSAALTTSGSYSIPASVKGNYLISVYADTGEVTVKFSSSDNTPYYIAAGQGIAITCLSRTVDSIIYTVAGGGKVYITVEAI